jgi:putative ABC transport system permease protein
MKDKSEIKPPRLADRLFVWYCNRASIDDLRGDLKELFHQDVKRHSLFKARFLYWKRILSLISSYAITSRKKAKAYHYFSSSSFNPAMLTNYFKTATRNLAKNKFFTVLNVVSLGLGMSISLLYIAWVTFIFRFDDFHTNKENIYRVTTQVNDRDQNPHWASAPVGVAEKLENFTGIEKVVRIQRSLAGEGMYHEKKISIDMGYFVDADFLTMFNFPLLRGDASTALTNSGSIVLTKIEADKIFGTKDPIGEMIRIEPFGDFLVTGVLADIPKNSHMKFGALASYSTWSAYAGSAFAESEIRWKEFNDSYVYMFLSTDANPSAIELYLNAFAKQKYLTPEFKATFKLQSLSKIVPGPGLVNAIGNTTDYLAFLLLGSITLITLIPACGNYINLSISQALNRMKEIGVRKVMGGEKKQIFFQFITETTIMMVLALLLSSLLFGFLRTEFLQMVAEADKIELTAGWATLVGFIAFALVLGIVTGIMPALYFAKISPVSALKGKITKVVNVSRFPVRKVLITVQFILSLGFILAVIIIFQQYRYSINYNLGFNKENVLDVELQQANNQLFRNEFGKLSVVQGISFSSHVLGAEGLGKQYIKTQDQSDSIKVAMMSVDENFISNFGLMMLQGENFSDHVTENVRTIIVNEEFLKKFKIDPATALENSVFLTDGTEVKIRGVVKNFHYSSLFKLLESFCFEYRPDQFHFANLKVRSTDIVEDFKTMEATWKTIDANNKFTAHFLTDEIEEAYEFYFIIIKLWSFLGTLAISVACLGLLGTVVFNIKNRVKEVSIRKVMGASSQSLVFLLSRDYILLMIIAVIITVPLVSYGMDFLLASAQKYNVPIGFLEIASSILIMTTLCLATIFSQTMKAANANPAENLRIE